MSEEPGGALDPVAADLDINRDITERAGRAQWQLAAIVEASDDAIVSHTLAGIIVSWNAGAERTYGYPSDAMIGRSISVLVPAGAPDVMPDVLQRIQQTERAEHCDTVHANSMGERLDVAITVSPVLDPSGKAVGAVTIARDVTERLPRGLPLRGETNESELANRRKTEFLSRMSHELRTPLTAILGFGQLLEMGRLTPAQQAESVDNILKAGRHLLRLIDDSVDIAGIEEGRISFSLEPVQISDVMREALDLIRPAAERRGIAITAVSEHDDCYLMADRQRLVQVFRNLLSNAVKYNREDGMVRVSCGQAEGCLTVQVADTGPGIAPEKRDRIFTPFERLGAEKSGVEGTGLGLALSLELVEAMGGTMTLQSALGRGSTFSVTLPIAARPTGKVAVHRRPSPALDTANPVRSCTVLYIEDNLANLEVMELVLDHRPGVRLISAMQGRLGLELAKVHHPDLILLDLRLADISGREVLAHLRRDPTTADIPVVILSAEAPQSDERSLLKAGATAYLTKPFNMQELLELLEQVLGPSSSSPVAARSGGTVASQSGPNRDGGVQPTSVTEL